MSGQILSEQMTRADLMAKLEHGFEDLVLCVVDVEKEIVAVDGEMHADLAAVLLKTGSRIENLWGIKLYPSEQALTVKIESMLNIKPWQGNRETGVSDPVIREKILTLVGRWFE